MKNKKSQNNAKNIKSKNTKSIKFPKNLLVPVAEFLQQRLKALEKSRKNVEKEDPFTDQTRVLDNASPDTDAYEQFGHARSAAIKKELDKKMVQTRKALTRIKIGKYGTCEDCGNMIDTDRLVVYPEAAYCAKCQAKRESK